MRRLSSLRPVCCFTKCCGRSHRLTVCWSKLRDAYAKLGCSPDDSDETVKTAYRKLAMRYHPDRLKAEGVPDSMIQIATRSMSEINAAWDLIRKERKYS